MKAKVYKIIDRGDRILFNNGNITVMIDYEGEFTTIYVLPRDFSNVDASYTELEEKKIGKVVL